MAVTAQCACGKMFFFPDSWADKTIFCRFCGAEVELGAPDPEIILPGASERILVSATEPADDFPASEELVADNPGEPGDAVFDEEPQTENSASFAPTLGINLEKASPENPDDEPLPVSLEPVSETTGIDSENTGRITFEEDSSPMVLEPVEDEKSPAPEENATEDSDSIDLTLEPD